MDSALTIGLDLRMIKPFPTGVGSHVLQLTTTLMTLHPEERYIVIAHPGNSDYLNKHFLNLPITYAILPIPGGSLRQYARAPMLARHYRRCGIDVLLNDPRSSFPGLTIPNVIMIYDLIGFHHIVPVTFKQRIYDRWLFRGLARASAGIMVSVETVKADVMRCFAIPAERISVASPSVAAAYQQPHLPHGRSVKWGNSNCMAIRPALR